MEYLKKVQSYFSSAFIYSNEQKFDEDFRQLLQIFYFYGFYQPVSSTKRTVYGAASLLLIVVAYFLGYFKNIFDALEGDNMRNFTTSVPYSVITFTVAVQTITFMARQRNIVVMVKGFQSMHEYEDEAVLMNYRKKCCLMTKVYVIFMELSVSMVLLLHFFGYKLYELVSPSLLDSYADGPLYAPLLLINSLQAYSVVTCMATSDLLHILCMVRAGANLELLSDKLRHCTDSRDQRENEKLLIACVKYHQVIIEETSKIQGIFLPYFIAQVCGTLVVLTGLLYIVMHSTKDDALSYVFGFVGLSAAMFEIGTLCFFGQWLTSKSADLLDATFDCQWYNQSRSFKNSLITMRHVCQREIVISAFRFNFSRETFFWLISNTYSYYNNMSQTVNSVGQKVNK